MDLRFCRLRAWEVDSSNTHVHGAERCIKSRDKELKLSRVNILISNDFWLEYSLSYSGLWEMTVKDDSERLLPVFTPRFGPIALLV